ncbi:putative dimodular nonribosomal peptide synthase [Methylorubrum populi]|uniref:Putative dimodular nonribosomal peptide synthase n=1 Tax=Methylorubrum populi TaxID=223967 RepID=A0A160PJX8_9HYPH|nr:putative dimodular nonribosomal peptide synthase [Methylorubrum populi]
MASVTVPGQQGARGIQGERGPQGDSGDYGTVRYGEMMGATVTDLPANTDAPFIVTAPRDVLGNLRGPFADFAFLDDDGVLRARKSGDSYQLSLRVTAVPQLFGGWLKIGIYIAGNISGLEGATSERTVPLTEAAGTPHRIDELFQVTPRSGFLANGAKIMLRASVPVRLSQETLFVTPLVAAP